MTNARMESFIIRRQRSSTTTEQTNISGRAIDSVADLYFGISGFFIMLIPLLKSLIEFVLAAAWTAGVFYLIFTAIKAL